MSRESMERPSLGQTLTLKTRGRLATRRSSRGSRSTSDSSAARQTLRSLTRWMKTTDNLTCRTSGGQSLTDPRTRSLRMSISPSRNSAPVASTTSRYSNRSTDRTDLNPRMKKKFQSQRRSPLVRKIEPERSKRRVATPSYGPRGRIRSKRTSTKTSLIMRTLT